MKIYYAHHIWKYNTKIEEYEIGLIREKFPNAEIVNPNGGLGYTEKQIDSGELLEADVMGICLEAVKNSDALVFSSMNGLVGKGVFDEIMTAVDCKIEISYLHHETLNKNYEIEVINKNRRLYAKVKCV